MATKYTAVLSGNSIVAARSAELPEIIDCVKWAEKHDQPADCCDIYRVNSSRVARYLKPQPGTYPAACGVWVNAKIA